jgi:Domain of unknown function (DUF4276)
MKRVHIICEGQTEETFVNEVLQSHLEKFGIFPNACLIGKPGHKGGNVTTARIAFDIKRRLLDDRHAWCTTFFDFYGLDSDFVGKATASNMRTCQDKARVVENALKEYIIQETDDTAILRFIPYIQMYEFEGLLFSNPEKMAIGFCRDDLIENLRSIRYEFETPEDINDSPRTAPSKRILQLMPSYEKPLYGSLAAIEIGLDEIRQECKLFNKWITTLESL